MKQTSVKELSVRANDSLENKLLVACCLLFVDSEWYVVSLLGVGLMYLYLYWWVAVYI